MPCFVPNCKSGYVINCKGKKKGEIPISLFRPPQDMVEKWNAMIQRKDRKLCREDSVCTLHFKKEDIDYYYSHVVDGKVVRIKRGYPKLKPGAIPSIFSSEKEKGNKAGRKQKLFCQKQAKGKRAVSSLESEDSNVEQTDVSPHLESIKRRKRSKQDNQKTESLEEDEVASNVKYEQVNEIKDFIMEETIKSKSEVFEFESGNIVESFDKQSRSKEHDGLTFTYKELVKNAYSIQLPSILWAIHRHPRDKFLVFSHTTFNPETGLKFDKGLMFEGSCTPILIFHGHQVPIPHLTKNVTCLDDVCKLLDELEVYRAVCLLTEDQQEDIPVAN